MATERYIEPIEGSEALTGEDWDILQFYYSDPAHRTELLIHMSQDALRQQSQWIADRCTVPNVPSPIYGVDLAPSVTNLTNTSGAGVRYVAPSGYSVTYHSEMLDAAQYNAAQGNMEAAATTMWLDSYLMNDHPEVNRQVAAFAYSLYSRGFDGSERDKELYSTILTGGPEGLRDLGFTQDIGFLAEAFVSKPVVPKVRLTGESFGISYDDVASLYATAKDGPIRMPGRLRAMLLERPFNIVFLDRILGMEGPNAPLSLAAMDYAENMNASVKFQFMHELCLRLRQDDASVSGYHNQALSVEDIVDGLRPIPTDV